MLIRFVGFVLPLLILLLFTQCHSAHIREQKAMLKTLKKSKEDSSYLYCLPVAPGKKVYVVQGYYTQLSHRTEMALDFKMKKGAEVYATRDGIVSRKYENSNRGGFNLKYYNSGNGVVIRHDDDTYSGYWHLEHNGVLVEVGDSVKRGQLIAKCGNTGYSMFPHVHFWVYSYDKEGNYTEHPSRFQTSKGNKYLKGGRFYRRKD